jgi:hypothetical protein
MTEPSIKGMVLLGYWAQLHSLLDGRRTSRDELTQRLEPRDIDAFDSKIEPSLWYPLEIAAHFSEEIDRITGDGGPETWTKRGTTIAHAILQNPNLASFLEGGMSRGTNAGPTLVKLSSLILNFGEFKWKGNPKGFEIVATQVAPMPDVARYAIQGVIEVLAEKTVGARIPISSERPDPDTIIYSGQNPV